MPRRAAPPTICRAMGGSVSLDSKLGSGATFSVRLPIT